MFSDPDNQADAAAGATAPEAETAPNSAHPETNSTVESATEQTAPPTATEHAEALSAGQEKPAGAPPERTGASTDVATAHAAAEANRDAHAADSTRTASRSCRT